MLQECPSRGHFYTLPQGNSVCQDSFPKVKEKIKKDLQFEAARANLSTLIKISGCSAVGSALDWGSRGREFKSRHSDQTEIIRTTFFQRGMGSDLSFLLTIL